MGVFLGFETHDEGVRSTDTVEPEVEGPELLVDGGVEDEVDVQLDELVPVLIRDHDVCPVLDEVVRLRPAKLFHRDLQYFFFFCVRSTKFFFF